MKDKFELIMATLSVDLEELGHQDLAEMIDSQRVRIGARERKMFIASYTLTKEDVLALNDPWELSRKANNEIMLSDRIRKKYWKHFPREFLKDRRMRNPKRGKHKAGAIFINRSEIFDLYTTAKRTLRQMKEFIEANDSGIEPPSSLQLTLEKWKLFPKKELSSEETRARLIKNVRNDLEIFEKFFVQLRIMWGKRGIASYIIYWS